MVCEEIVARRARNELRLADDEGIERLQGPSYQIYFLCLRPVSGS
jgi:hypothetical protein